MTFTLIWPNFENSKSTKRQLCGPPFSFSLVKLIGLSILFKDFNLFILIEERLQFMSRQSNIYIYEWYLCVLYLNIYDTLDQQHYFFLDAFGRYKNIYILVFIEHYTNIDLQPFLDVFSEIQRSKLKLEQIYPNPGKNKNPKHNFMFFLFDQYWKFTFPCLADIIVPIGIRFKDRRNHHLKRQKLNNTTCLSQEY